MPVSWPMLNALWFVMRLVWAECLCVVNYGSSCGDMGGVRVPGVLVVCGLVTWISVLSLPSFKLQHWPWSMRHRFRLPSSSLRMIFRLESGDHCRVSSLPRGQQCSAGYRCADQWSQRHLLCVGSVGGNKSLSRPCHCSGSVHCQTPSWAHMRPVRTYYYR